MKKSLPVLPAIGCIVCLVLLFWPFAQWNEGMQLVLRFVPALCAQWFLCLVGKRAAVRAAALVLTGALALWGIYLFAASPHWAQADFGDLAVDYLSPLAGCAVVYGIWLLRRRAA